jgi:hypothetical protein
VRVTIRHAVRRLVVAIAVGALVAMPGSVAAQVTGFGPVAFDIDAAPNGSILVAGADGMIYAVRDEAVQPVASVPVPATAPVPSTLNGIASIGSGNYFATTGGGDLAAGAKLWRVAPGGARMVADIEAFEIANDPDATMGLGWKDPACEAAEPFSAGPQSNPYHLAALSGKTALVADAAGNSLLAASTDGLIEVVATFTPPVIGGGASTDPADWMVLFPLDADTNCYVQPVPTSVAIGPDGAYYVGELTGATPALTDAPGLSRVWRIAPGARDVVCPSAACQLVVTDLTSVIDLAFGPDGMLYVVEYDVDGWLSALIDFELDGAIKACDVGTGACSVEAGGLALPGAITFDKAGTLWLLEGNIIGPVLRTVDLS